MSFDSYLQLAIIVFVGFFSGSLKLYNDLDKAIDIFNRFSLYIAFPVLMFESIVNKGYSLPSGISFYLVHIISVIITILSLRLFVFAGKEKHRNVLGALAIGSIFGNVAYLGIPICSQIIENKDLGIVSLSAAIHLVIDLSIGQILMVKWSTSSETSYKELFRTITKQPLIWSPIAGMLCRFLPENIINFISIPLSPIATSAGPVALYMLGLYLYANRKYLVIPKTDTFIIIFFKMIFFPLIFSVIAINGYKMGLLTLVELKVLILQSTMPVAITTFSLTYQYKAGQEIIAQSIVITTFLSFLMIPLLLTFF